MNGLIPKRGNRMRDEIDFSGKWIEIESAGHFKYITEISGAKEPPCGWGECVDDVFDELKKEQCFIEFGDNFKISSDGWCWKTYKPSYGEEIKIDMPKGR